MSAMVANPDSGRHGYTVADVRFMQHMIAHHAQALAMTSLVSARTSREDMRLLAERIDVSQKTEISMMQRWLRERGEVVPNVSDGDMHGMAGHDMAGHDMTTSSMQMPGTASTAALMPGMLTPAQMDALAKASSAEFDRLFLQGMIQHHEGAIVMVANLFATQGAGQESETFRFASDVDTDQRAEIRRMRALLAQMPDDVLHR
jgi:uncharacterized protein (DUF305 family)